MMNQSIEYLVVTDPVFKKIIDLYGYPTIPFRPQGFETLVLLILEQQVSIDSAKASFIRLKTAVDQFLPQNLVSLAEETFRNCGVSRQKTKYIKCLAVAILEKEIDLNTFENKTVQEVRAELIKIKGIGNWTIDIYLMFCLQSVDILPLGDIAVVNTIKELLHIEKVDMENYTQKWAPHRSMATFLLWHYYLKKRNRKVEY
jgi:DNA-3-methyladenine glycosylase II